MNAPAATRDTAALWDAIHAHLEAIRRPIQAEIGAYPMPITGCDAQYNHLLEKRDAILREIGRYEAARKSGSEAAEAFVSASVFLDSAMLKEFGRSVG